MILDSGRRITEDDLTNDPVISSSVFYSGNIAESGAKYQNYNQIKSH